MAMRRLRLAVFAAPILTLALFAPPTRAEDRGQFGVVEENDSLFYPTDKHYTQGIRFSYLTSPLKPDETMYRPFDWFGSGLFGDAKGQTRFADWGVGQSIFTPADIHVRTPDPRDRPYAGWLYSDLALIQDSDHNRLDTLDLQLGVVGPLALGRQVQNDWHIDVLGVRPALGWNHQLHTEPGLVASYNRKLRLLHTENAEHFGFDVIPEAGVSGGNIFTYAAAGAMVRVGLNLASDYGPPRIQPGQSGSDYYNPDPEGGAVSAYVFAGTEGRLVARNIFLDGNSFRAGPSVNKRVGVGDASFGGAVRLFQNFRLTYTFVERSKEFTAQEGADRFSSFALSYDLHW